MRRGYWTGFIMGGLVGMVAARAYGDRLMDAIFPGMVSQASDDVDAETEANTAFSYKPRRRRRARRDF